jgi:predicted metal-binding membrane protein
MSGMPGMAGGLRPWTAADVFFALVMWAVMMVGMMLPSAAPVMLLVAAISRRRAAGAPGLTAAFALGYILAWGGFSVVATALQWGLHAAALLSPRLATTSPLLEGGLLVAAGVYQLTPLKAACLAHCRSPLGFLMTEWRDGVGGALRMGFAHGLYCLGCCALLMGLLFVAGVMNLLWVAVIALFVLVEKVAPGGPWVGRLVSWALIGAGLVVLARALAGP